MSFDVAVWRSSKKLANQEARVVFQQLNGDDVSSVVADDSLLKFYQDLDAVFPLGGDLPDELLDELPWSWNCSPSRTHYILGIQGPKGGEALTVVTSLVQKYDLVLFDPQSGIIEIQPSDNPLQLILRAITRWARAFRSC